MPNAMLPAIVLTASYFLGSLPFGLLIAKWWKGIDVREHGSGNIGATNVYRVVGKPAGIVVFVLDVGKGVTPPLAAAHLHLSGWWQIGAGATAILGHSFSPFLGFKGGKGVATGLGVLFGIAPMVGLIGWAAWGVTVAITGYVSLGSIVAAIVLAPLSLLFYKGDTARLVFCICAGIFGIFRHRANIGRLLKGTESSFKKRRAPDESTEDKEK